MNCRPDPELPRIRLTALINFMLVLWLMSRCLLQCFIWFHGPFLFLCSVLILLCHIFPFMANNLCFKLMWIKTEFIALAGVAQWDGHRTAIQKVAGLVLSRGTCLGYGSVPSLGGKQQSDVFAAHLCFSPSLFFPSL